MKSHGVMLPYIQPKDFFYELPNSLARSAVVTYGVER